MKSYLDIKLNVIVITDFILYNLVSFNLLKYSYIYTAEFNIYILFLLIIDIFVIHSFGFELYGKIINSTNNLSLKVILNYCRIL